MSDAYRFPELTRRLLLLSHSKETVADLEAVIQEERDVAFDAGYRIGLDKGKAAAS